MIILGILLIIYEVIVFVVFHLLEKKASPEIRGVYLFGSVLSAACPPAGVFIALILRLAIRKHRKIKWADDYSRYISFDVRNDEAIRAESLNDRNLVSFSSGLALEDRNLQKKLIVQLSSGRVLNEGKFLRKAISLNDAETVHYAATTLNVLSDRYRKQLDLLLERFRDTREEETAVQVSRLYSKFLLSHVLPSRQEGRVRDEFLKFLTAATTLFPANPLLQYYSGSCYLREKNMDKAELQFMNLTHSFPSLFYGYSGLLEIYYKKGNWGALYKVVDALKAHVGSGDIPDELRDRIGQLGAASN